MARYYLRQKSAKPWGTTEQNTKRGCSNKCNWCKGCATHACALTSALRPKHVGGLERLLVHGLWPHWPQPSALLSLCPQPSPHRAPSPLPQNPSPAPTPRLASSPWRLPPWGIPLSVSVALAGGCLTGACSDGPALANVRFHGPAQAFRP